MRYFHVVIILFCLLIFPRESSAKKNQWVGGRSSKESKWDIGAHLGMAYFAGSMNMYKGDRFSIYNVTDSKPGLNFNFHYRYNFGHVVFADLDFNYSSLSGGVTYYGTPTEDMDVKPLDESSYKTSVVRLVPMVGFDVLNLFAYDPYERDLTLKARGGIGMTYTTVKTLPFEDKKMHYDFGDALPTDLCSVLGLEFQKTWNEKLTFSCLFDYTFVAGSRIDAYWIDQSPEGGGIPGPEEGSPVLLDTYISFSAGFVYRIGGSSSVNSRTYLREYKGNRRRHRKWYQ